MNFKCNLFLLYFILLTVSLPTAALEIKCEVIFSDQKRPNTLKMLNMVYNSSLALHRGHTIDTLTNNIGDPLTGVDSHLRSIDDPIIGSQYRRTFFISLIYLNQIYETLNASSLSELQNSKILAKNLRSLSLGKAETYQKIENELKTNNNLNKIMDAIVRLQTALRDQDDVGLDKFLTRAAHEENRFFDRVIDVSLYFAELIINAGIERQLDMSLNTTETSDLKKLIEGMQLSFNGNGSWPPVKLNPLMQPL